MEDLFSLLASGASFSKKKNAESMKVFRGPNKVEDEDEEGKKDREEIVPEISADSANDEINAFRNRLRIKVHGVNVSNPLATFHDMPIDKGIRELVLRSCEESEWKEPTPIQMQSIPTMMDKRDVLAGAPTGSGKTAAYLIPMLSIISKLNRKSSSSSSSSSSDNEEKSNHKKGKKGGGNNGIIALLLAPTRELAEQVHREAVRLVGTRKIKMTVLTKQIVSNALKKQDKLLLNGVDFVISTPMRLLSLVRNKLVNLSTLQIAVLDEADKLLEIDHYRGDEIDEIDEEADDENSSGSINKRSSFLVQVDEILGECDPELLQRGLFSATVGPLVQDLAGAFLRRPVRITVGVENAGATSIDQKLTFVTNEEGKLIAMRQLIQEGLKPPVLIFLQSKERSKALYKELLYDGINVDVIHAERSEQQREAAISSFRRGETWVLICTDLMARGVDFKGVQMVINYDLPQSAVSYIHRIGRTGRAGRKGKAVTFFTEKDISNLRSIANVMKLSGCEVPDWMLSIKSLNTKQKRQLKLSQPERAEISTLSKYDKKKMTKRKDMIDGSKRKSKQMKT